MIKVGIFGAGNMGEAIIAGIHKEYQVIVCEMDRKRSSMVKKKYGVMVTDPDSMIAQADIVILAVKPQNFDSVLQKVKEGVTSKQLIVSIAAGITTKYIENKLERKVKVVRAMPNLPVQVLRGVTAVTYGKSATRTDAQKIVKMFKLLGLSVMVEEKQMDLVTAVSGSGPAYVFLFTELFQKAAQSMGMSKKDAYAFTLQTVKGSALLLESTHEDPNVLRQRVTSKGGTTQAALDVLNKSNLKTILSKAIKAAKERSKELSL